MSHGEGGGGVLAFQVFFLFLPRILRIVCLQFYLFCRGSMFYSCCFIWCPIRFPWNTMFVSFNSNTTGITSGVASAHSPSGVLEFIPRVFSGCCSIPSFLCSDLWITLCLLVLFLFTIGFDCLSFELRILITSLISSNDSEFKITRYDFN